jgi:hypothetical protein
MAILVTVARGNMQFQVGNGVGNYTVSVQNTGAAAVTLQSLQVVEATESDAILSQPVFLTPNTPVGVGNPVIAAGATVTYGFQAVFTNPVMPGPSPQAPGGAAPSNAAYYSDPTFVLQATSFTSDGTVATGTLLVPVASATVPQSNGGALVLSQGFNVANFITL